MARQGTTTVGPSNTRSTARTRRTGQTVTMITGRRASREAMQKYAAGMLGLTPSRRRPRADHKPAREPDDLGWLAVAAYLGQALIARGEAG